MELLRRPEVDIKRLLDFLPAREDMPSAEDAPIQQQAVEQVEIQAKYAGYLVRQQSEIDKALRYDHLRLPEQFDYTSVPGLSNEVSQKLSAQRPETLGQASRIPGMTPAAVSLLLVHLKKKSA